MGRFDSEKNWSIMIDPRNNEIRNRAMQKIKFEQIKRRTLHDFTRKTKDQLLSKRREADKKDRAFAHQRVAEKQAQQLQNEYEKVMDEIGRHYADDLDYRKIVRMQQALSKLAKS